jgi:hypothetical protein
MESDLSGLCNPILVSIPITEKEFSHGTTQLRRKYSHYL